MSKRFDFIESPIKGLYTIKRNPIGDHRGFFSRFFCAEEFRKCGLVKNIAQINHSLTAKKGTVRGLHFQYPSYSEVKIVSCVQGKVLDVAVDIREGSPTFLQHYVEVLSAENQTSLYIPEGFAHGFQALSDNCELLYLVTSPFESTAEGALNINDPKLEINWPLPIAELSERDKNNPMIKKNFKGIGL